VLENSLVLNYSSSAVFCWWSSHE